MDLQSVIPSNMPSDAWCNVFSNLPHNKILDCCTVNKEWSVHLNYYFNAVIPKCMLNNDLSIKQNFVHLIINEEDLTEKMNVLFDSFKPNTNYKFECRFPKQFLDLEVSDDEPAVNIEIFHKYDSCPTKIYQFVFFNKFLPLSSFFKEKSNICTSMQIDYFSNLKNIPRLGNFIQKHVDVLNGHVVPFLDELIKELNIENFDLGGLITALEKIMVKQKLLQSTFNNYFYVEAK